MGRVNKSRIKFKALDEWMKALDRKISIKVGIIGQEAGRKHPDSGLTNVELGAVHEFGATITVTDKMRNYLHSQGLHLKKDTITVVIPTRSFLRMPLMSSEGKKELMDVIKSQISPQFKATDLQSNVANEILDGIVHLLAETAYLKVLKAFDSGGFGNWAPVNEFTIKRRTSSGEPPLTDSGDLRRSISYEIKETK